MDIFKNPPSKMIGKLSHKLRRRIDSFASKDTFSGAEGRTLHYILAQTETVFQKDIEEELGIRSSTATELLKKMEKNELIYRVPTNYDARLKKIIPTKKAEQYKNQVMADLTAMEEDLVKGISEEDLEVFYRVLKLMEKNMQ